MKAAYCDNWTRFSPHVSNVETLGSEVFFSSGEIEFRGKNSATVARLVSCILTGSTSNTEVVFLQPSYDLINATLNKRTYHNSCASDSNIFSVEATTAIIARSYF